MLLGRRDLNGIFRTWQLEGAVFGVWQCLSDNEFRLMAGKEKTEGWGRQGVNAKIGAGSTDHLPREGEKVSRHSRGPPPW